MVWTRLCQGYAGGHECARPAEALTKAASPATARGLALRNPVDEQVDHGFRHPVDLALRNPPAREMTVDLHPGKAIDQRPAGNLHLLEVGGAKLAPGCGIPKQALCQLDQLGIVARERRRRVVVEMTAGGNDLEMGGVLHCPPQIGQAKGAKALQRIARWRVRQGSR